MNTASRISALSGAILVVGALFTALPLLKPSTNSEAPPDANAVRLERSGARTGSESQVINSRGVTARQSRISPASRLEKIPGHSLEHGTPDSLPRTTANESGGISSTRRLRLATEKSKHETGGSLTRGISSETIPTPSDHETVATASGVIQEARPPVGLSREKMDQLKLTPREREAVADLDDRFQETIEALPDKNPDSPDYFRDWKNAQRLHDEQLRITLGWDRFNSLSAEAASRSKAGL